MRSGKILLFAAVLLLLIGSFAAAESTTVMMYMCGSTIYEDCIGDIEEMCRAQLDDVNVVVLAGGTPKWHDKRLNDGSITRFVIRDGAMADVEDLGRGNMGKPSTLSDFILYAGKKYPADRNILVLWDHGGGTAYGICSDDTSDGDMLQLSELAQAFSAVNAADPDFHLDIIGADACLMATYEMSGAVCRYADYLVASEELEPGIGWNYTPWLSAIAKDPDISEDDICRTIVDSFMDAALKVNPSDYVSLSAVDLGKIPALQNAMEEFTEELIRALPVDLNTFIRMRERMYSYGSFDDASSDMVDLAVFIDAYTQFAPAAAKKAKTALAEAVLYTCKSSVMPSGSGLSILMPQETRDEVREYINGISDGSIPNHVDFITRLTGGTPTGTGFLSFGTVQQLSNADLNDVQSSGSFLNFGFVPAASNSADLSWIAGTQGSAYGGVSEYDWIAGTAGGQSAPADNSSWIAGTAGGSTDNAPQSSTASWIAGTAGIVSSGTSVSGASVTFDQSFIAGSAGQPGVYVNGNVASLTPESALVGYELSVTADDVDNLSSAEGMLRMDLSDDEYSIIIDLGSLSDTWIDWKNGEVYSLFDGTWPALDGMTVPMYDQAMNGRIRRSLIPCRVNGTDAYLVVIRENGSSDWNIAGYSKGYDTTGLPTRGITPLKNGDVIEPLYHAEVSELSSGISVSDELVLDPIVWNDGIRMTYEPLDDEADYLFSFVLKDIYGDSYVTDPVSVSVDR